MNATQDRRFNMFLAVQRLCLGSPDIVSLNLAFQRSVTTLAGLNEAIMATIRGQELPISGVQSARKRAKDTLTHLFLKVANLLSAYAEEKRNDVLLGRVSTSAEDVRRMTATRFAEAAESLIAHADTVCTLRWCRLRHHARACHRPESRCGRFPRSEGCAANGRDGPQHGDAHAGRAPYCNGHAYPPQDGQAGEFLQRQSPALLQAVRGEPQGDGCGEPGEAGCVEMIMQNAL
jgi:hypothetical protein